MPRGQFELTEEQKAAKAAKRNETVSQKMAGRDTAVVIGPYRAFKFDEWNYCVRKDNDEKDQRYFPNIAQCLNHILHQQISTKALENTTNLLAAIKDAEKSVTDAISHASL